jgi:HK97 family phage prohead protease
VKHKTRPAQMKALGADAAPGQFEAYVSVFGNVDSVRDVVLSTAFDETLAEWKASGDPIPVVWSHKFFEAAAIIGHVVEATPDEHGLKIVGQLDLDGPDGIGETARMVHHLMQRRTVRKFSFTYDVEDVARVEADGETTWELRKLKLYEVGPCLIGANELTDLLDVKALAALVGKAADTDAEQLAAELAELSGKVGRALSAEAESKLRQARDLIGQVVATVEADGKAKDGTPAVDLAAHLGAAKALEDLLTAEQMLDQFATD